MSLRWDRKHQAPPERCGPDGSQWRWHVMPWELKAGDRILGTSMVVASGPSYSEGSIGSNAERAQYTYDLTDGRSITYVADAPCVSVIRSEGPA